ncbi:MAG TPA: VOC family protein [Rubellimicrobium sp.]|nr:VOC family protein [Rubellimicrobium sp.]
MATSPYLHFQGQCAEALAFYADVFGGTDLRTMLYAEGTGVPEAWTTSPRIMHGQVTLGGGTLMGSDFPPGFEGDPQKAVSVMQTLPDVAAARAAFDRLADGGALIQEFGPSFFSPGFGMVRDRFGTHWIISAELDGGPSPDEAAEPEAHPT